MQRNRRRFLKETLIAGACLGAFGLASLARAMGRFQLPRGIVSIDGSATMNGLPARVGTALTAGDTLATAADGQVVFVIGLNAFLLRGSSRVVIPVEGNLEQGKFRLENLRLDLGGLLSVFEPGQAKRLITTTAVAGTRGTALYAEVLEDRSYICLCYGEIDLVARDFAGVGERLKAKHHETPRLVYAQGAGWVGAEVIVPAGMLNHTDAELSLLEQLVGRRPPFAGEPGQGY